MHRKYFVYIDDGNFVYKIATTASCEEDARRFCDGNGEIIAVKDVTDEYHIQQSRVFDALMAAKFDECEIDWVCRALNNLGIVE